MTCQSPHARSSLLGILGVALITMPIAAAFDYDGTLALRGLGGTAFLEFMERSVFEGDALGAGDIGTIVQILAFATYLTLACRSKARYHQLRPTLGFLAFVGAGVGIVVQGIKVFLARPRPGGAFAPFWQISAIAPDRLFGSGSFPSGHTAQIALLLSLVYIWHGASAPLRRLAALVVFIFAGIMGFSRVAGFKHWLTDTFGAIFLCWLLIHCSYFFVLKIPEQRTYWRRWGQLPANWPRLWEIVLLFWLALAAVSTAAAAALWRGHLLAWAALAALGLPFGLWQFWRLRRRWLMALGSAP